MTWREEQKAIAKALRRLEGKDFRPSRDSSKGFAQANENAKHQRAKRRAVARVQKWRKRHRKEYRAQLRRLRTATRCKQQRLRGIQLTKPFRTFISKWLELHN